jgi:sialic acid synthase SpsE
MNEITLAGRKIGINHPPLVIAEMGINHNGDLEDAFKIVDAAFGAGVEVVKHQTHVVEDEMSPEAKNIIPGNSDKSIYDIMASCALDEEDEIKLKDYVESKGMIFISTPFSRAAADRLQQMGVVGYKIGSGECNNYPLIKHIASFGKPIILSTGMNTIDSVSKAVKILESAKIEYALLHTTNLYPTPPHLVRLGAMVELQASFPNAVIGLSDHTVDNFACFGAIALGASILERHFTDTMERDGPDISCSMDVQTCKELIKGSRIIGVERGGHKGLTAEEQVTMDFAFATVVTISAIKKGEKFTGNNIWVKRPGTGDIRAEDFESILEKIASSDIAIDTHLSLNDIE